MTGLQLCYHICRSPAWLSSMFEKVYFWLLKALALVSGSPSQAAFTEGVDAFRHHWNDRWTEPCHGHGARPEREACADILAIFSAPFVTLR